MSIKGGSGGSGGAKGVRAGAAYVELFGDDTKLARMLSNVKHKMQHFGQFMGKIGLGMAGAGAGILAPLTALLGSGSERAEKIGEIAEVFNLTAESASKMASAFEISGGSIEDLEKSLGKLAKANTAGGPLDQFLLETVEDLEKIDNASERFRAAEDIFGGKFARQFQAKGGQVKGLLENAPGLSEEEIKNAKTLNQELARTGIVLKSALLPALEIIGPAIKGFLGFVQANAKVLQIVAAVAGGLVTLGSVLAVTGFGLSGLAAGAGMVVSALGLILTPVGLVVLAIAGITAAVALSVRSAQGWGAAFGDLFHGIADAAATTFGGIVDAIKAGNFALAGEIAFAGLRVAWTKALYFLEAAWVDFKKFFVDGWHDAVTLATQAWLDFSKGFDRIIEDVADFLIKTFIAAVRKVSVAAEGLLDAVGMGDESKKIGDFIGTLDKADAIREQIHQRELKRIDKEANAKENALFDIAREDQRLRDEARAGDLDNAANAVKQAQDELNRLRDLAAQAAKEPPAIKHGDRASMGMFGQGIGAFAGMQNNLQFAFGGKIDKDSKDIVKNTSVLPKIEKHLEGLVDIAEADGGIYS